VEIIRQHRNSYALASFHEQRRVSVWV